MGSTESLSKTAKVKSKNTTKLGKHSKYLKPQKRYMKLGNYTRQVSARRISTISEDCEVVDEHHSTLAPSKTEAQVPPELTVKKSMIMHRQAPDHEHSFKTRFLGKVISGPLEK